MTEEDVIGFVSRLPGVVAVTVSEATGAPEVAWGDTFVFYDPDGDNEDNRKFPFATIVTKNYAGFDEASDLNRPGVFRVNIAAGRRGFQSLFGYPPAAHAEHHARYDYAALDQLMPHPVYATQGWVSILNPGDSTAPQLRALLAAAHSDAVSRHHRRHG